MASMSDYLEGQLIDHLLRTASFTKPTNLYVALFTTAGPGGDNSGTANEVSGSNYARVQVGPSNTDWAAPTAGDGVSSNLNDITFPTATGTWGTIVAAAIYDASTGGNLLFHGNLNASKLIENNDTFIIAAGDMTITWA